MGPEQASIASTSIPRKFGRLLAVLAVGLLIALLAYGLTTTSTDDAIDQRLVDGRTAPAPGFDLELLEQGRPPAQLGKKLARAAVDGKLGVGELRGSPVVLNLWASWCTPCVQEAPLLQRGWKRWGRHGVVFVGLDMQDLRDDARAFLRRRGVDYPTIRDPGKKVARRYGATGIPETYFMSAAARVVAHCVGVVSEKQLESGVAAARSGRPLARCRGGALRPPR